MTKILILINDNNNNYFPHDESNYKIRKIYNSTALYIRILFKIILKFKIPLKKFIFREWISDADKSDMIILFDTGNANDILNYLKKRYIGKRIILWYWNTVSKTVEPQIIDKEKIELWSFDFSDCKKYGLFYNTQFYFCNNIARADKSKEYPVHDIFFIGTDKDRIGTIKDMIQVFETKNLNFYFYVVSKNKKYILGEKVIYGNKLLYTEILGHITTSKVIVDIVIDGQDGLTLRPLEALFFRKKLITNYKRIKEMDFYNKNNIFIWGEDSEKNLCDFINTSYDLENYEFFINEYDVTAWLSRF